MFDKVKTSILNVIKFHKKKILVLLLSVVVFTFLVFPYSDLTDFMTSQVAEMTGNEVYLQADELSLSPLTLGVSLENVVIETSTLPAVQADELTIAPLMTDLLALRQGLRLYAEGLFKGSVKLYFSELKGKNGQPMFNIKLNSQNLQLASMNPFLRGLTGTPWSLQGDLSLDSKLTLDSLFQEQPKGDVQLSLKQFHLPARTMNTDMGPLRTPDLKLQGLSLKGSLADGRLVLEQTSFGDSKDEINGSLSGDIGLQLSKQGDQIVPTVTGYDLKVDMSVQKAFQASAGLFFILFDQHKTEMPESFRYRFRIAGRNTVEPPQITAYQ